MAIYSAELLPPFTKFATKALSSTPQHNPTLFLTARWQTTQIGGVLTRTPYLSQTKPADADVSNKLTPTQSQSLNLTKSQLKKLVMKSYNSGKHTDALYYLQLLVERGHKPLLILATKLMQAFFSANDINRAVQVMNILETHGKPDVFAYNAMISGLSKSNRIDLARKAFGRMITRGYSADVVTYNIMIGTLCSRGDLTSAMEVFDNLKREGRPGPSVVTYTILIEATISANGGGVMEAMKLLEDMRRRELKPDMYLLNTIIRGMCKEGMEDLALRFVLTLPSTGCQPDVISYNTVLRAVLDKGEWEKGKMILNMMTSRDCDVNVVSYSILITALCREGRVEEGMDVLSLMLEQGMRPDRYSYEPLISAFCRDGRVDLAIGVLDIMITNGCLPDMVNYTTILSALCKNGEADVAVQIFDKLSEIGGGCEPDVASYNTLICTLWQSGGDRARMVEFVKKMIRNGVEPDHVTYNSLISWLCRDGLMDKAIQLLEDMKVSVLKKPSVMSYNMVILGLCKARRVDDAIELLVKMVEEDKCLPSETTYVLLVEGIGFTGWQNDALELADLLLQRRVISHDSILRLSKTFHVHTELLSPVAN